MKLFVRNGVQSVALFGSGLIGSTIGTALRNRFDWRVEALPYTWTDRARRAAELGAIVGSLPAASGRVDLVWAAGVSGFGSSSALAADEIALVAELCAAAGQLAATHDDVVFHLVSSGGGLFEGQTDVGPNTRPAPRRPYGFAKLEQERMLRALPRVGVQIYRPASVYGFQPGGRRGLFATLIANGLANRSTLISGTERTIRDYVFADDIGRFIAHKILAPGRENGTHLLASGKPTSMFEAVSLIERLLGRPPYRRFEANASNALDLSFAPSGLPAGWSTTPLPVGLAVLNRKLHDSVVRRP